jgi:hypothetical protein
MPSITDMVQQHLGDQELTQLTQHLGVDPATARAAAAAALPALVGAAQNRTMEPPAAGAGGLLGNLFGGSHKEAAQQVSHHSGLDIHQAEKALLFLAPIVMARLAQQRQAGAAPAAPAAPAAAAGQTAPEPAQEPKSGFGGVIDAVERIFHKGG